VQLGLLMNLRNHNPLENAMAVPSLMQRGKFRPFAKRITGLNALRRGRKS